MGRGKGIFDLSGKVALVTGGARGLGRCFCEALAEFGADISVVDIDKKGAEETAEYIERLERKSVGIKADISSPEESYSAIEQTVAALGSLDILINNAGISARSAKIHELSFEDWNRVLAINLGGVFLCTRFALPEMIKKRKGCIINIASTVGIRPHLELVDIMPISPYIVSKAGVISFTKETALEYARDGIRVNCIAPGWHAGTQLSSRWRDSAWKDEHKKRYEEMIARVTPMGRRGRLEELKGLVVYLASDASSFVTGQVFASDGGVSI
jgi:NAD(P)-dependent dehydrogenase (short-subunit alcohol dehydrogenase family)